MASLIALLTMIPPSGRYPEVTPFANERMSGLTFQWPSANQRPVRQKPVMTSSAIISTLWRVGHPPPRGQEAAGGGEKTPPPRGGPPGATAAPAPAPRRGRLPRLPPAPAAP